jgi:dienelactone hydrolase
MAIAVTAGAALLPAQKTIKPGREAPARLLKIDPEPPPVKVNVRSRTEQDGLLVDDIDWTTIDDERVPAWVIGPAKTNVKYPAVVCLHGSSGSRDSETTRQFGVGEWTRAGETKPHKRLVGWARELARHGYVTLSLTQRGLDTRMPNTNDRAKDMLARGRTLMGALVYEIRQAVSHLAQRPDVRPDAIGMTGMSFGGITTFYTWIVDPRITAAAPICGGVGSVDVFLKRGSRGYHGFYWWIPDMLTVGDHGDFAAAMAPRPLMVWAPRSDIGMPAAGVDRFLETAKPAYDRLKAGSALVVHRPPGEHEFTLEAFQAMRSFFDERLRSGGAAALK